jgi:lariat debranching enzyme
VIDYEISNEQLSPETAHSPPVLSFDPEWLAISRAFHPWLSTSKPQRSFPVEEEARTMIKEELEWVSKNVPGKLDGAFLVSECQTFVPTAPGPGPAHEGIPKNQQRERWFCLVFPLGVILPFLLAPWYTNPQTEAFCGMLEIANKINPPPHGSQSRPSNPAILPSPDPSEVERPAIDPQITL